MKGISRQEFQKVKRQLIQKIKLLDPVFCCLFGSFARGDWTYESDLDVLIVMETDLEWHERSVEVMKFLDEVYVPLEPHVYTVEEFIKMRKKHNPFIEQVLKEGEILHGQIPGASS